MACRSMQLLTQMSQQQLNSPSPPTSIFSGYSPSLGGTSPVEFSKVYNSDEEDDTDIDRVHYKRSKSPSSVWTPPGQYFERSSPPTSVSARMEDRVERMFHPLQHQLQNQSRESARRMHGSPRANDRNKYYRQQQLRSSKREALKSNYRGSMEEFVFRQEEEQLRQQIEHDAEVYQVRFQGRSPDDYDHDYDADDDNDEDCAEGSSRSDTHEQELEEYLAAERLELEEMTKNLSLN